MNTITLVLVSASALGLVPLIATSSFETASFASVGAGTNATLAAPVLKDPAGKEVANAKVNQMVIISTALSSSSNNSNNSMPFIIVVEARDELGITRYSQFALGSISPDGSPTEVGLSWTPKVAGTFELRAFALSDWDNPMILAPAQRSLATVQG